METICQKTKSFFIILIIIFAYTSCSKSENENVEPAKPTSISFPDGTKQLLLGASLKLEFNHLPTTVSKPEVNWKSSAEEIVSVNSNGEITGLKLGNSTITATSKTGNLTASIKIEVLPVIPSKLTLQVERTEIFIGDSLQVNYKIEPFNTTNLENLKIDWSSSDSQVFSISKSGLINGLKEGKALIIGNIAGSTISEKLEISVISKLASEIKLNEVKVNLSIGESFKFIASVFPENTTDKNIVWESSDPKIASILDGNLIGLAEGKVTITAKNIKSGKLATAEVVVHPILAQSISISQSTASLFVGGQLQLSAKVFPENTTDKNVIWESSNPQIVSVSNGLLTAKSVGAVDITVKSKNNNITAVCRVTVQNINVTSLIIDPLSISLEVGTESKLNVTVLPTTATDKSVSWESSNPEIVSVKDGFIKALKIGSAIITARSADGLKTAKSTVNVLPIRAKYISLNKQSISLYSNESTTLIADVFPIDAANKNVIWTSSNSNIVSVDSNSKITAKSNGNATISVRSEENPNVISYCNVYVKGLDEDVSISNISSSFININGSYTGNFSISLINRGTKGVNFKRFEVIDSNTGKVVSQNTNEQIIDNGIQLTLSGRLNGVYNPIANFYFEIDGQSFKRSHQFK